MEVEISTVDLTLLLYQCMASNKPCVPSKVFVEALCGLHQEAVCELSHGQPAMSTFGAIAL